MNKAKIGVVGLGHYIYNEFLERWCEAGPTHHLALGTGHRISTIKKFARISGIELIIVK